ncbi:MAG TPA: hypothetical protein VK131_06675 [Candidatus Acidoferrales bacterium]|nr:hypothetical protein [Candidatus Acidoferrales bacterium]
MPADVGPLRLSRRDFLVAANAAALLALLEGCVPGASGQGRPSPSIPAGASPYERALLLLRDAVRASPDHLAFRSAELAAGRDAGKIVQFVRDRISVLPPLGGRDDPLYSVTWGTEGTLRGGQGTLRERAELLAQMLTRAGFPAQVLSADRPAGIGLGELYRRRAQEFAPDQARIDAAKGQLRQAGLPAPATPAAFDPGPDAVAAILAALPQELQTTSVRDSLLPKQVPVVAFVEGGKKRYAFALGDLPVTDAAPPGLGNAPSAQPPPSVTITISALANPPPGSSTPRGQLVDLVSGRWPADALVGRQLLLAFVPAQGPKACLQSGLPNLPVRLPLLRVQTEAPPGKEQAGLVVVGSPITVQGDVFPAPAGAQPSPAGTVEGPYGPIKVLSDAERRQAVGRAAGMKATAAAPAFPEVELQVAVTDAAGRPVDGFDAKAFTVKEQGKAVDAFSLYSNVLSQPRPRVLIAYDTSPSVTTVWPEERRTAFEHRLAAAVTAAAAAAPFDAQVVSIGAQPDPKAWALPLTEALAAALPAVPYVIGDETWRTLAGAALDQGVTAIVVAADTDDDTTDQAVVPVLARRLAATGVPVYCLPIGPPAGAAVTRIVSASGGVRLDPDDPASLGKLTDLLRQRAASWIGAGYRLRYRAPADGPARRAVTVGLAGRDQPQASADYQVPEKPLPPPSFVGLYATIVFGPLRATRRLAGLTLTFTGAALGDLDDPAATEETRAALNGVTTIAFEPGTPTGAALLDDVISSYLSIEPLRAIWKTAKADQLLEKAAVGLRRTPAVLATMLQPAVPDAGALPMLKVAILQERQRSKVFERHADLAFGLNPVIPVTQDPSAAYRAVVADSVAASAAEAMTFEDSAYRRLAGRRLLAIPVSDFGAYNAFMNGLPADRQDIWKRSLRMYGDKHVLVPAAGDADAFWVVEPYTGVTKAVLLDGTGGGFTTMECDLGLIDYANLILGLFGLACGIAAPTGAAGAFACLGVTVASIILTVVALFIEDPSNGKPYGGFTAVWGASNPLVKRPTVGARFGVAGVVLLLTLLALECG